MRIVYFGTPQFACPFLQALIDDPLLEVMAVVCQPDKPVGRGGDVQPAPVKVLAQDHLIAVHAPKSLKENTSIINKLQAYDADLFVVVAYGKIIPLTILEIPRLGALNVHPSLLPRHRGPSPMQGAIVAGDARTGVAIMQLDEGMDTGALLATETIELDSEETYSTLEHKVQTVGPPLLAQTIHRYGRGEIMPVAQDNAQATLTKLLHRDDGRVEWSQSVVDIERKARGWQVWPGLWTLWERTTGVCIRLKLHQIRTTDFEADLAQGRMVVKEGRLLVDAGDGTLEILMIQPEGKPKMNAQAFIAGYPDCDGALLT